MTFNIRHALGLDGKVSLERVARIIEPAEIVFLSEVDRYWLRSGLMDQPAALQRLTGMPHAFFAAAVDLPGPSRQYGNLLLSRFPILRATAVPLPQAEGAEARVMIEAQIDVEGEVWFVFGVHLGLDREERRLQLETVRARAASVGDRRLLLGDFNAPPDAPEMEALASEGPMWVDALAGAPGTFPAWKPAVRIDHVLLSPGFAARLVRSGVEESDASDHRPAWVDLRLSRPPGPPAHPPAGVRP
ncbi:hypothetical protein LIP_3169 [Limnochorda pilosa]|uniref:Endonuclease/exonuclease/phosphatase domain-containing protein n=2 Tax=Limnochorda pilosa TaxID=1555112 RepID=A0A0K2SPG6_LIMPI|nr:hypothetical protein LIP_3169 [Limnochorda pilosa]